MGCLLLLAATALQAQQKNAVLTKEQILAKGDAPQPLDKKFKIGISWNQYWSTISGSQLPSISGLNLEVDPATGLPVVPSNGQPKTFFWKPSVGFNVRAEYYPLSFIGVGIGLGYQQRGTGIINEDKTGGAFSNPWVIDNNGNQGDADSTYRERARFNGWELPITLLLRTPKEVIKGVKLSAACGVVLVNTAKVNNIFLKVEDGFHKETDLTKDHNLNDVGLQFSIGPDINAGSSVFQAHVVYTKGTTNVYKKGTTIYGNGPEDGKHETIGFRVTWFF